MYLSSLFIITCNSAPLLLTPLLFIYKGGVSKRKFISVISSEITTLLLIVLLASWSSIDNILHIANSILFRENESLYLANLILPTWKSRAVGFIGKKVIEGYPLSRSLMVSTWTINSKPKGIRNYVTNSFLTNMSQSIITKYNDLPANSLLRHPNSFVANRMKMSFTDVIKTLYGLNKNNIKNVFHIPDKFDVPGIYCFLSKDGSSFYIGSSVNMKNRYNRHMSNLNHTDKRNSLANPKFYNYVRKYGMDALDFGCLLVPPWGTVLQVRPPGGDLPLRKVTKNYLVMYSGFNLTPAEISLLKSLTQWDLLITEQYFIDIYGISLNVAAYVGTRESSILSDETRKKMSVAHMNLETTLSKDKWEAIRTKAKEAWGNDPLDSARRKAISVDRGRSVIVKDSDHNIIADFPSQLKAAEYLRISRNRIGRYLNTGTLLDSKVGSVYITDKGQVKPRSIEIQVLDVDRNILDTCSSIRATAVKYNLGASSLSVTYLNKDKLYKNKYYFVSDSNTSTPP